MNRYERLERTWEGWQAMRQAFRHEWEDAFRTTLDNYGPAMANRVADWYYLHACRQVDERWPEHRRE